MAEKLDVLIEAERRGILPDSKREVLAEARRRGLVSLAPVPLDPLRAPDPGMQTDDRTQWQMLGGDLSNAGKGLYRGLEATAQGGAQLAMRAPHLRAGEFASELTGVPNYTAMVRQSVDDQAKASADAFANSEAGQSLAGNVGQFTGEVLATAPLAVASLPAKGASLPGYLRSAFVGGATGAGVQPVTEGDFGPAKFNQVLIGGTAGAGTAGLLRGGMATLERLGYAPNALAQVANAANRGANRSGYAQAGEELAERTGVRMTPGQVSGSRVQTALENMSRQSVFSSDIAMQADEKIAEDAVRFINRAMDGLVPTPAGTAQVGERIQLAAKTSVARILKRREEVAGQQFGPIERVLGDRQFVDYSSTRTTLDDLIDEYSSVATPEADRIVAQAKAMRGRLTGQHTLGQFQRQRSYFGRASQGQGTVFDDIDRTVNQRVAKRLYAAMSDDLDTSASRLAGNAGAGIVPANYFQGQVQAPGIAAALREANANYRRYSQLADGLRAHPVARLFGKDVQVDGEDWFNTLAPEQVVTRLGSMAPTEIRMVRQYMEGADPEAWQQYKRLLVQNALDAAQTLPASAGPRQVAFNAGTFLRTLGGDKPARLAQLRELYSAEEMSQIDDAFKVARRLGDRFGSNPSGTGPYMEVQSFLASVKQRSVEALASTGGEALGLRKIANVMLNADGRRALIELSKLPPQSRQAASLAGFLAGVIAGKQAVYPDVRDGHQRQDGSGDQGRQ
ncbi:MAG: hypothetical protein K0M70_02955 [Arenimonas sp.]|uniref:hypothetical protein n=1 Tax=Arenimonas sp. TaxID=1872635 RepID=UPI0025C3E834|nr:hypothetical protein [Arenimonas sp.]MBW8366801.1 hypothetical protein [Arenimonas sp.]